MSTTKPGNIPVAAFERFLQEAGCEFVGIKGGHAKWRREGCLRSIVYQTHIDPIPEFVIENNLRSLGIPKAQFRQWLAGRHKKG